jgi:predicted HAD superfamily hydrolase
VVKGEKQGTIYVNGKSFGTMMDNFQELLEEYEGIYEGFIDYIHDEDMLLKLTEDDDCVGFIMPRLTKEELVTTILDDGILPKKSFSVGLARDKRYYLECRKIR